MKKPTILFISKFIPAPAFDGGALRNKAWLEFLSKRYHVILIGFWNKKYGATQLSDLSYNNIKIHGIPFKMYLLKKIYLLFKLLFLNKSFLLNQYYDNKLNEKIIKIIATKKIKFVFCSELATMQYVDVLNENIPIYFDDHNVEFKLIKRISANKKGLQKIILHKESELIKSFENKCVNRASKTFVVSQVDKETMSRNFNIKKDKLMVINNVFDDHGGFKQGILNDTPKLIFVGNLSWMPNKDGLFHFLTNIFPKIIEKVPNAKLDILGSNLPQSIIEKSKQLPVNLLAEISDEDKKNAIDSAWVGIVPLYFASGSRIKILEFWSHGKCVVTTDMGLEGLPCPSGTLLVDSDKEFVNKLIAVLKHKEKLQSFGFSNYSSFKQHYFKKNVYEDTLYNTFSTK